MIATQDRGLRAARDRAYALADSGQFDRVHAVEQALIAEGWPNAGEAFQSDFTRKAVAERCRVARKH
ncbi:MAG: hypothetical protein ABW039_12480 [Sphingobium sp.]